MRRRTSAGGDTSAIRDRTRRRSSSCASVGPNSIGGILASMPVEYEDAQVRVTKVVVGPMVNNVYFVRCAETGDAVMVDAADEAHVLLPLCQELTVGDVLITHGHG